MALASKNFADLITFTRASGGGRFNASGQYEWLAANTPRIDYDPVTGECLGILVEGQRTNLYLNSNSQTAHIGTAVTPDAIAAPDGTITADLVYETTGSGEHYSLDQNISMTAGTVYTYSAFVKAASGAVRQLYLRIASGGNIFGIRFNPSDQSSLSIVGAPAISYRPCGNGWYRVSMTFTAAATATSVVRVQLIDASGSSTYTGDGSSGLYVWGCQFESGAFPSSYIPTTSAQVTRAADVASVDTLSPWYNAAEGTLVAEFSSSSTAVITPSSVCGFDDGSINNRMQLRAFSGRAYQVVSVDGVVAVNSDIGAAATNTTLKIAGAFKENDFIGSINGATPVADTVGAIPVVTKFNIGNRGSADFLNGPIKSIRYYPKRLTNAELQELTV